MYIIGGTHRRRKLISPKGKTIRPTSGMLRETVFNICQTYIAGARFLDLFAGAGGMGLEALSRGASHATFVDYDKGAVKIIRDNLQTLKETARATVITQDVFDALASFVKRGERFDLIFADPPYGSEQFSLSDAVLQYVDTHDILDPRGELFLEDDEEAYNSKLVLKKLTLKSVRNVGRSQLRQYAHINASF